MQCPYSFTMKVMIMVMIHTKPRTGESMQLFGKMVDNRCIPIVTALKGILVVAYALIMSHPVGTVAYQSLYGTS